MISHKSEHNNTTVLKHNKSEIKQLDMDEFYNTIKETATVEGANVGTQFLLDCVNDDYTVSGMPIDKFTVEKSFEVLSGMDGTEVPMGVLKVKATVDEKTISNKVNRRLHSVLQLMFLSEELTYPANVRNIKHTVRYVNDPVVLKAEVTIPVNQMYIVYIDNFQLHVESEMVDANASSTSM